MPSAPASTRHTLTVPVVSARDAPACDTFRCQKLPYVIRLETRRQDTLRAWRVGASVLVLLSWNPRCKPGDGLHSEAVAALRPYVPGLRVPVVCWAKACNLVGFTKNEYALNLFLCQVTYSNHDGYTHAICHTHTYTPYPSSPHSSRGRRLQFSRRFAQLFGGLTCLQIMHLRDLLWEDSCVGGG